MPSLNNAWSFVLWSCIVTTTVLPIIKNVVANTLIRSTGQPPWRFIELAAMASVYLLGIAFHGVFTIKGLISFIFVFVGRALNTLDAVSDDQLLIQRKNSGKHEMAELSHMKSSSLDEESHSADESAQNV